MMLKGWIRLDNRTKFITISGKMSEREQELFRRLDSQKGAYQFIFSPRTGKTMILITEHQEWTGSFAKKGGAA